MAPRTDVAVVGCGPVGATLAVLLAQRGWQVTVVERQPSPYPLPRAVHIDDQAARTFQACGLGADLPAIIEATPVYEWRNAGGTVLLRLATAGVGAGGWPVSAMFAQPELEQLLRRRLDAVGVDLRWGTELVALEPVDDAVELGLGDGSVVEARYAVGCDGANSTLRRLTGVAEVDMGFSHDWLIVDVVLRETRVFDPVNLQVCDPHRPTTAVSGGPGRRRWEFMRLPGEQVDELASTGAAWDLLAPWDVHPGNATIERHALYTFAARHARRWRTGRTLLAGDAAHQMPPFAGQGLCAGVRDAANLAWKLDLVLAGHASDALLDAYEQERRPDVEATIGFSLELGKVICLADPGEAAERDAAMAPAAARDGAVAPPQLPPIEHGFVSPGSPWAGHLLPQGSTAAGRADDVHGTGWQLLLAAGVEPPVAGEAECFAAMGGTWRRVEPGDTVLTGWLAEHGCGAVLQRPDFRCYASAVGPGGVSDMLAALRLHLGTLDGRRAGTA